MVQGNTGRNEGRPGGSGGSGSAGGIKAVLIIVVAVLVGVGVLSRVNSGHSTTATAETPTTAATATAPTTGTPTTSTTVAPPNKVKLQVLNGVSRTSAYAGEFTTKLAANPGYVTEPPANATTLVTHSAIYVLKHDKKNEGLELATAVGLPASVVHSAPPPATAPIPSSLRTTADLALVIGPDFPGLSSKG